MVLGIGPFLVRIHARIGCFSRFLFHMYREFPLHSREDFADIRVRLRRPVLWRRYIKPQVCFERDGKRIFHPFPLSHAPPLFEWGLNWCIATRAHHYLMLHAAVLERQGRALILPATPGSGKSTLCAALMHRGWRLLSDEFGLVRKDGRLDPLPRPIPLKNESIAVIREFAPEAELGPAFPKTRKGTVAHVKPTETSVRRMAESARPAWIVFPHFQRDAEAVIEPVSPSYAFLRLAFNAFNYEVLGAEGFRRVSWLIRQCRHFNFTYGRLEDAIEIVDSLAS
ncbi:MAG TPA: HprK-related kinase A [Methylothermaceae bacterium]|nr:HprK-related kinase A [Methylothermaceae bacterium]